MAAYEVILHERGWAMLTATRGGETRRLLARLDEVKEQPFRRGDFQQRDASGRINEVILLGDWLKKIWPDTRARRSGRPPNPSSVS